MEVSVVADDRVTGLQAPVTPDKPQVPCSKCDSSFSTKANLKRHYETKHADQSLPEIKEKAVKLKAYKKKNIYERRKNDEAFRVKNQQISQLNRDKKKAQKEAEDVGTGSDMNSTVVSDAMDMTETHIIEDSIEDSQTETPMTDTESDHMTIGSSSTVKKSNENDAIVSSGMTMPLTKEDVTEFFMPEWDAPWKEVKRQNAPFSSFAGK